MEQQSPLLGTDVQPVSAPTGDEKTMALLAHVLTIVAGFIAPLIIWLVKKDESSFVAAHAKESLNFQITCIIVGFVFWLLILVLIGLVLLPLLGITALVLVIIASIKANEGKLYRYPFNFRLIK